MVQEEVVASKLPNGGGRDISCMTRLEFCRRNRISESFYHKLKKLGLGPVEMRLLNKTLITFRAEAEWQVARQENAA